MTLEINRFTNLKIVCLLAVFFMTAIYKKLYSCISGT